MAESNKINIIANLHKPFASEQITISNSVKTFTDTKFTDTDGKVAKKAFITCEDAEFRYTLDNSNPTASVGHRVYPSETIVLIGSNLIENFKAIRKGTTDAKIFITYSG